MCWTLDQLLRFYIPLAIVTVLCFKARLRQHFYSELIWSPLAKKKNNKTKIKQSNSYLGLCKLIHQLSTDFHIFAILFNSQSDVYNVNWFFFLSSTRLKTKSKQKSNINKNSHSENIHLHMHGLKYCSSNKYNFCSLPLNKKGNWKELTPNLETNKKYKPKYFFSTNRQRQCLRR